MFIELQPTYFALKRWSRDTAATKRRLPSGSTGSRRQKTNDRPLPKDEVERMKSFLQDAPTS
jgi:hypothetical protein